MTIVGHTYLERGQPVVVVAQWRGGSLPPVELTEGESVMVLSPSKRRFSPRNVLIRRSHGELVVRPFRGLRKVKP